MSDDTDLQKQNVIKFFDEVMTKQNFALIPELLADGYTFNGSVQDPGGLQAWVTGMHAAMPGMSFVIETILAEGQSVALRWRLIVPDGPLAPGGGHVCGTNIIVSAGGKAITNDQNDLLGSNVLVLADGTHRSLPG